MKAEAAEADPAGVSAQAREVLRNLADTDDLSPVAELVKTLTRADGCAIAMREGPDTFCRGRAGLAPQLGTRVDPNSGISGECLRTGSTIRCDDTANDPRLSGSPLRSVVAVAIRGTAETAGVITVFALQPNAFDIMGVVAMKDAAAAIADFRDGRLAPAQPEPEPNPVAQQREAEIEPEVEAAPDPNLQQLRAIFQRGTPKRGTKVVPMAPPAARAATAAPEAAAAAPRLQPEAEPPAPAEQKPTPVPDFGLYSTVEDEPGAVAKVVALLKSAPQLAKHNPQRAGIALAAVVLVIAALFWFTTRGEAPAEAPVEIAVQQAPAESPAQEQATQPAASETAAPSETAAKPKEKPKAQDEEAEEDAVQREPAPIQLSQAQRVNLPRNDRSEAPTLQSAGGTPLLSAVPVGAAADVRFSGPTSKLVAARIVTMMKPVRPSSFRPSDAGAIVLLRATVGRDGQVTKVDPVSGPPHLMLSAVAAVRKWRFDPAKLNNEAIESTADVKVTF